MYVNCLTLISNRNISEEQVQWSISCVVEGKKVSAAVWTHEVNKFTNDNLALNNPVNKTV